MMKFKHQAGAAANFAADMPGAAPGGGQGQSDALAKMRAQSERANAEAFLTALSRREAREAESFVLLISWARDVMKDDESLVEMFGVSMATLKRWANGETTPLALARESVRRRLDVAVRDRFNLPPAKPVELPRRVDAD